MRRCPLCGRSSEPQEGVEVVESSASILPSMLVPLDQARQLVGAHWSCVKAHGLAAR